MTPPLPARAGEFCGGVANSWLLTTPWHLKVPKGPHLFPRFRRFLSYLNGAHSAPPSLFPLEALYSCFGSPTCPPNASPSAVGQCGLLSWALDLCGELLELRVCKVWFASPVAWNWSRVWTCSALSGVAGGRLSCSHLGPVGSPPGLCLVSLLQCLGLFLLPAYKILRRYGNCLRFRRVRMDWRLFLTFMSVWWRRCRHWDDYNSPVGVLLRKNVDFIGSAYLSS